MPLFVSKYREYSLGVDSTRAVPNQFTGESVVHQKGIVANFKWAGRGLEPWALEQANDRFQFTGLGHNEDPLKRISFFDTDAEAATGAWDEAARLKDVTRDEIHAHVVDVMRKRQNDAYFEVVRPSLAAPWPNYDKVQNAKALAGMVSELGIDVGYAINYERENENREEVIAAFEAIGATPEVEEEVEVTA